MAQLPEAQAAVSVSASAASATARAQTSGKPLRLAAVVTAFTAEAEGDLSLQIGQVIVLTKARADKRWWKGYLQSQPAKKGVFPKLAVAEPGPGAPKLCCAEADGMIWAAWAAPACRTRRTQSRAPRW